MLLRLFGNKKLKCEWEREKKPSRRIQNTVLQYKKSKYFYIEIMQREKVQSSIFIFIHLTAIALRFNNFRWCLVPHAHGSSWVTLIWAERTRKNYVQCDKSFFIFLCLAWFSAIMVYFFLHFSKANVMQWIASCLLACLFYLILPLLVKCTWSRWSVKLSFEMAWKQKHHLDSPIIIKPWIEMERWGKNWITKIKLQKRWNMQQQHAIKI